MRGTCAMQVAKGAGYGVESKSGEGEGAVSVQAISKPDREEEAKDATTFQVPRPAEWNLPEIKATSQNLPAASARLPSHWSWPKPKVCAQREANRRKPSRVCVARGRKEKRPRLARPPREDLSERDTNRDPLAREGKPLMIITVFLTADN